MKRFLLALLISFVTFFGIVTSSYALENASTAYDITYTVEGNGETAVLFTIKLTNTTSKQYVSAYKLRVGFDTIANVKAADEQGPITPLATKEKDGYILDIVFNKHVVGVGKTLAFTVSFTTPNVVQKNGNIWEINIPGMRNKNEFTAIDTHVKVPSFLGKPSYVKPPGKNSSLDFSKEQLGKSGISLLFGNYQTYQFSLLYHLKNTNIFQTVREIALPPSTNYQDVLYTSITPKPENVRQDKDGNWIAQFALRPSQHMDVKAEGKVKISLHPSTVILSSSQRYMYTREQPYWEYNNKQVKELAKTLKTPRAIYAYVVKNLTYDFSRVSEAKARQGAMQVLLHPDSAVCLEFTDLFIALARAAGIPAREVDGFAYTKNAKQRPISLVKDVLHAWPQYYDDVKKTWVMVDPTWGNTTGGTDYFHALDFDHFAFVIKGYSSTSPLPAGGYKLPNTKATNDVRVTLSDSFDHVIPKISFSASLPKKSYGGLPITGEALLENSGGVEYPADVITIKNTLLPSYKNQQVTTAIPPYGKIKVPLLFGRAPLLTNTTATLTITLRSKKVSQSIAIEPLLFTKQGLVIGGLLFASITIIILVITARTRRLPLS